MGRFRSSELRTILALVTVWEHAEPYLARQLSVAFGLFLSPVTFAFLIDA
jgi:hypothetical protein